MKKRIHSWGSDALGFEMPVAVYGHWGVPLLMFPTATADFEEYERYGLVDAIGHWVDSGVVKLYSVDSINDLSLFDDDLPPDERARLQQTYDRYIVEEVIPFIHEDCGGPIPIATVGASMGAYHALNSLLRHPQAIRWCIGMSGFYDIGEFVDGATRSDAYFNNPPHYMRNMSDPVLLDAIRTCSINLIVGQGPWEHVDWTSDMARVLWNRGIPCNLDLWGEDVSHDWPWWKVEMDHYVPRLFGHG